MSDTLSEREQIQRNIRTLLNRIGNYTKCPACKKEMWWVTHKNGKKAPYSVEAVVHFKECTAAEGFGQPQKRNGASSGEPSSDASPTAPRVTPSAPATPRS